MTTLTATPTTRAASPSRASAGSVTFGRVVAAEWVKLRSLRSTAWSLVIYVAVMAAIPLLQAWAMTTLPDDIPSGGSIAALISSGYPMGQLVIVVLGVLAITNEYSTGLVRATFAAVPRRTPVLAAKALVLVGVSVVATVLSQALAWLVTLPFHAELGLTLDLGADDTLRLLGAPSLYIAAIALLGLGVGALMRHSAGAITTVVALLLVIEGVISMIPFRLFELISPFLPSTAGQRVLLDAEMLEMLDQTITGAHLTPWQGYGVLLAWVAVLLGAAVVLLRSRDA